MHPNTPFIPGTGTPNAVLIPRGLACLALGPKYYIIKYNNVINMTISNKTNLLIYH